MKRIILILMTLSFLFHGCGSGGSKSDRGPDPATQAVVQLNLSVPESILEGEEKPCAVSGSFADGSSRLLVDASWSSEDTSIAAIDPASGVLRGVSAGTTRIHVAYKDKTASAPVRVSPVTAQVVSHEIIAPESILRGEQKPCTVQVTYSDGTSHIVAERVSWSSDDDGIVSIDTATGLMTGVGEGTTTIHASFEGKSASAKVRVEQISVVALDIEPVYAPGSDGSIASSLPPHDIPKGMSGIFRAMGRFSDGSTRDLTNDVEWTSESESIAVFDGKGKLRGVSSSATPATITVSSGSVSGSTTVVVFDPDQTTVRVLPENTNLAREMTRTYQAIGDFTRNGRTVSWDITSQVSWSSSDSTIASIDVTGTATAHQYGYAEIKATCRHGEGKGGLSVGNLEAIDIERPTTWLHPGLTADLKAVGRWAGGYTRDITEQVTWSTSAPAIATVSNLLGQKGKVSLKSKGMAVITAAYGKTGTISLQVTGARAVQLRVQPTKTTEPFNPSNVPLNPLLDPIDGTPYTFLYTVDCRFEEEGSDPTYVDVSALADWETSNQAVASVNNDDDKGKVKMEGPGTVTIRATVSGLTAKPLEGSADIEVADGKVPLELHMVREDGPGWRVYPLPEICDGNWCEEWIWIPSSEEMEVVRTYKLVANDGPLTVSNIKVSDLLHRVTARFGTTDPERTIAPGQSFVLNMGEELTFTLESQIPQIGHTAKVQWSFDVTGGTRYPMFGTQFIYTRYIERTTPE